MKCALPFHREEAPKPKVPRIRDKLVVQPDPWNNFAGVPKLRQIKNGAGTSVFHKNQNPAACPPARTGGLPCYLEGSDRRCFIVYAVVLTM
jgi:hypothetical protein